MQPQALLRQARAQIGRAQPAAPERPNISRATIEYLRLELDKLRAEKVQGWLVHWRVEWLVPRGREDLNVCHVETGEGV